MCLIWLMYCVRLILFLHFIWMPSSWDYYQQYARYLQKHDNTVNATEANNIKYLFFPFLFLFFFFLRKTAMNLSAYVKYSHVNFYGATTISMLPVNSVQIILGPCKPKSESWIPPIWNLNPESKPFWNMNPRKLLDQTQGPRVEIWIQNLTHFEIWILNLALFEIWIQNPWSVWNLNPESLDPPLQGPYTVNLWKVWIGYKNLDNSYVYVHPFIKDYLIPLKGNLANFEKPVFPKKCKNLA